jgi:membrane protein implicated in regulation of membrane protease activity
MSAMGRRRWLGVLVLTAALAMLIAGETVLRGRLRDLSFLAYWLVCFALTGLAILVALLDARALRRKTRRETRELLQSTLDKIGTDTRLTPPRNSPPG